MGRDILGGIGITGAVDDTPAEQDDYVAKTFGFYPSDVHPGLPVEDDRFVAPPDDILQSDATAHILEGDLPVEPRPTPDYGDLEYFDWIDRYSDTHHPGGMPKGPLNVIEGIPEPTPLQEGKEKYDDYIDRGLEEMQEPLPFDEGKEDTGNFRNTKPTRRFCQI